MNNAFVEKGVYLSDFLGPYLTRQDGGISLAIIGVDRKLPTSPDGKDYLGKQQNFAVHYQNSALAIDKEILLSKIKSLLSQRPVSDFTFLGKEAPTSTQINTLYDYIRYLSAFNFSRPITSFSSEEFYAILEKYAKNNHPLQNMMSSYIFEPLEIRINKGSVKVRPRDFLDFSSDGLEFHLKLLSIRFSSEGTEKYVGSTWSDDPEELKRIEVVKSKWERGK